MGVAEIKCYDNAQLDANYQKKKFFLNIIAWEFLHITILRGDIQVALTLHGFTLHGSHFTRFLEK